MHSSGRSLPDSLLNGLTPDRIGVYDLAYITKQGVAALQLYRQFPCLDDYVPRYPSQIPSARFGPPLDQLILNDEITVHQLVGMPPADTIFVEFQFIVCAERTWRIAPLQHLITLFTDIVVDDVEIFFDRPVDE